MQAKRIFEILMRENADMLHAYLRASVRDSNVADDVFQETMLVAWKRIDDFDQQRSLGPWLRGIASKLVLAHYRKSSAAEQTLDQADQDWLESRFAQLQQQPGDSFAEKLVALRECVDSLPQNYRDPIQMRYQQDLTLSEIGKKLSLAIGAIKKRLTRAILEDNVDGFVEIHTKKGTDKIVGATIVAENAGDMISEISVAMANGLGLSKVGATIHPYPTQSKAIRKLGDQFNKTKLTSFSKVVLSFLMKMNVGK